MHRALLSVLGPDRAFTTSAVSQQVAASTTLVARRGHWMAPQKVLGEWCHIMQRSGCVQLFPGLSRCAAQTAVHT